MNIFSAHEEIFERYKGFIKSFINFSDQRLRNFVEDELFEKNSLWPGALIQLNPSYKMGRDISELVENGELHETCKQIFKRDGKSIKLYQHQEEAIARGLDKEHFIVTSGTGSGKSITFLVPLINHILQNNPERKRIMGIIVYPMNALINSQVEEIEGYLKNLGDDQKLIKVGAYTGQQERDVRDDLKQEPPHILLTNYVMLELMLTRYSESKLFEEGELSYLVFDEVHTYRGRRGADVSLLLRRLRQRTRRKNITCIGTSATMASAENKKERQKVVSEFGSRFFGIEMKNENIIEETLRRTIPGATIPSGSDLRWGVENLPQNNNWDVFSSHPLAFWIENKMGIKIDKTGVLRRRPPSTLGESAKKLASQTDLDQSFCEERLKEMLIIGSKVESPEGRAVFPFKLHQFVSQGDYIYATLEGQEDRFITMEGQIYAPGREEHLLYPLVFCRICGKEYYVVHFNKKEGKFFPGELDDYLEMDEESKEEGYIFLEEVDHGELPSPDFWFDKKGKIKKDHQKKIPSKLWVKPDGTQVDEDADKAQPVWFQKKPFGLCINCGEAYKGDKRNDFTKLGRLSTEGRSSACTLININTVNSLQELDLDEDAQKILSFTDNRQDASLQAGHFNDFVQVALIRSALYRAIKNKQVLYFDNVADEVLKALDIDLSQYSREKDLDERGPQAEKTKNAMKGVINYLLYKDLERGWRLLQPNLEQVGLLKIRYAGLKELCMEDGAWKGVPFFSELPPDSRISIIEVILDEMRRSLAIGAPSLEKEKQEKLKRNSLEYLNDYWGLEEDNDLKPFSLFVFPEENIGPRDKRISPRSLIGQWLKEAYRTHKNLDLANEHFRDLSESLFEVLKRRGIVTVKTAERWGGEAKGYVLKESALEWVLGDEKGYFDPLRRYKSRNTKEKETPANKFFQEFYKYGLEKVRGMQGAEHTAQLSYDDRIDREKKFRKGELSSLFCSPTMELGIDIADLNAVYLRNVPPTPANYAQRSGRAGRAGQPALIITYCSSRGGHDQYYFKKRKDMVSGIVNPPRFDLSSEDLIKSHMHSIWLGISRVQLDGKMGSIIDLADDDLPIRQEVWQQIDLSEERIEECKEECKGVMESCKKDIENATWLGDDWLENILKGVKKEFNDAFERWRTLYKNACNQFEKANEDIRQATLRGGMDRQERQNKEKLEIEAKKQLYLLRGDIGKFNESDFYPYRYLGGEGFIPGYNFPSQPIRAFLRVGESRDVIARDKSVALSEYGPFNTIYHNGSTYEVSQALFKTQEELIERGFFCKVCGYAHMQDQARNNDVCKNCGASKNHENALQIPNLMEMTDVSTQRRTRINCDEEERRRKGFEVTSHFNFSPGPGGELQKTFANVKNSNNDNLLKLVFGPATNLYTINHKWRRSKDEGFNLDLNTGTWLSQTKVEEMENGNVENVKLYVKKTANAILFSLPSLLSEEGDEEVLASLQYALLNGIQEYFQTEEGEIAAERVGQNLNKSILFWEAAEGSLGILNQLTEENIIGEISEKALEILHFNPETGDDTKPGTEEDGCAAACYHCLLSYYNQPDHRLLNRYAIKDFLMEIKNGKTLKGGARRDYEEHYRYLREKTDNRSELEKKFLDTLFRYGFKLPDDAQKPIEDVIPDFFIKNKTCIFCDGAIHDEPQQKEKDKIKRQELKQKGYRVIIIRYDQDLLEQIEKFPDVFGEGEK